MTDFGLFMIMVFAAICVLFVTTQRGDPVVLYREVTLEDVDKLVLKRIQELCVSCEDKWLDPENTSGAFPMYYLDSDKARAWVETELRERK